LVALDVEAGAKRLRSLMQSLFKGYAVLEDGGLATPEIEAMRAILRACKVVVPDATGTGLLRVEWDSWPWLENESGETVFDLNDDGRLTDDGATYTITITRKREEE